MPFQYSIQALMVNFRFRVVRVAESCVERKFGENVLTNRFRYILQFPY